MNKQELIDYCNAIKENKSQIINCIDVNGIIKKIEQLDEPEKVKVPQFVAGWMNYCKLTGVDLYHAFEMSDLYLGNYAYQKDYPKLKDYFKSEKNQETFARAWLDGYTVEKEERYRVKMKNAYYNKHPQFLCETDNGIFWAAVIDLRKTKFTRKELKEAGFGWVFNCPGIEVEEVE